MSAFQGCDITAKACGGILKLHLQCKSKACRIVQGDAGRSRRHYISTDKKGGTCNAMRTQALSEVRCPHDRGCSLAAMQRSICLCYGNLMTAGRLKMARKLINWSFTSMRMTLIHSGRLTSHAVP